MNAALAMLPREAPLDPDLAIVDCHHHLWDYAALGPALSPADAPWKAQMVRCLTYDIEDLHRDLNSGHKITATVHVECGHGYYTDGPPALKPVGETKFAVSAAQAFARDQGSGVQVAAAIVAYADLALGDAVKCVLEAHQAAGGERFRSIRHRGAWDADCAVMHGGDASPGLYRNSRFRAGFRHLADLGIAFDAWLLEPQLPDLVSLAKAFPHVPIVVNHLGSPLGAGRYAGSQAARFGEWRRNMAALAALSNVHMKLGGLGMDYCGLPGFMADPPYSSTLLAEQWRPWIDTAIDLFGPDRCMFESNYPSESGIGSYNVIWNAFKRTAAGYSAEEKADLFSQTAARFYGIADRVRGASIVPAQL